ncbi:tRNA-specific 2-thiouridylase MnmA [Alphaproteobacteria bacterium]|nr:tRNA-specific 2-thiouridylase MnmA [Alphaproteobacteria bacterium]
MKYLVGMSGGVDSSVAALLLRRAGHEIVGATMAIWDDNLPAPGSRKDACLSPSETADIEAAAAVCALLGIEHRVIDCRAEYRRLVLDDFRQGLGGGRTPNPCVRCNVRVKFGALPAAARAAGVEFDRFATGHWARIRRTDSGRLALARAADEAKDQTYFLYRLTQEQLAAVEFPLGEMTKAQARELARQAGLAVADKPDSQDFYAGDIADLLGRAPRPGRFVDAQGRRLGQHEGYWRYTVGQRRGLGIGGLAEPLYVVAVRPESGEVVLGPRAAAETRRVALGDLAWGAAESLPEGAEVQVKLRSTGKPVAATVENTTEGCLTLTLPRPALRPSPGQSAVLYDHEGTVLAGGIVNP